MNDLIQRLQTQLTNLHGLLVGTQSGESETVKEISQIVMEMRVRENEEYIKNLPMHFDERQYNPNTATEKKPFTLDECINPSSKELPQDLFDQPPH